ncbi:copia protein, partial [Trifolium medium]|nr:copia protein [Trifolium medium]
TSLKEASDTLERCYTSGAKVKKVKLQALRRKYEHAEMEEQEKVEHFFNRVRINLAMNLISHGRSKHIETRFRFIKYHVKKEKIGLFHCPTEIQEADILTKALKHDKFKELRNKLGVVSFEHLN